MIPPRLTTTTEVVKDLCALGDDLSTQPPHQKNLPEALSKTLQRAYGCQPKNRPQMSSPNLGVPIIGSQGFGMFGRMQLTVTNDPLRISREAFLDIP